MLMTLFLQAVTTIAGNLISWKGNKQILVARCSAKTEYRAIASSNCEQLLKELQFGDVPQMTLICDNQTTLHKVLILS